VYKQRLALAEGERQKLMAALSGEKRRCEELEVLVQRARQAQVRRVFFWLNSFNFG
jgi:hypothetical protein